MYFFFLTGITLLFILEEFVWCWRAAVILKRDGPHSNSIYKCSNDIFFERNLNLFFTWTNFTKAARQTWALANTEMNWDNIFVEELEQDINILCVPKCALIAPTQKAARIE